MKESEPRRPISGQAHVPAVRPRRVGTRRILAAKERQKKRREWTLGETNLALGEKTKLMGETLHMYLLNVIDVIFFLSYFLDPGPGLGGSSLHRPSRV